MKKLLILLVPIIIITGCTKDDSNYTKEVPYKNIKYQEVINNNPEYACITFYSNGKYSMYDCDSEPTNYFFDSENECTYTYNEKYLKFNCKYNYSSVKNKPIEILTWDQDTFSFKYGKETKTFKSESWIKQNIKQE